MGLLEVDDLSTSFLTERGILRAVDGVSLSVAKRGTLGIVGETGSGKTMLIRSIMGLLPSKGVIRRGSVRLDGKDIAKLSGKDLRAVWGSEIAMVFQNPMTALNPVRTIGAQIAAPLRLHQRLGRKAARSRAVELLHAVGIPEPRRRVDEYPHQISGGMRQRVVTAIALSCEPRLLLADEPTTALDVTVQQQVLDLLYEQKDLREMAIILVTHDLGVVATHSDDVAVMYGGRIVEKAPTRELLVDPQMPYTEALLESVPRLSDPSHTRLNSIDGRPPDLQRPSEGCAFAPRCRYAQERCSLESPPLEPAPGQPDHLVACWYPVSIHRRTQLVAQ